MSTKGYDLHRAIVHSTDVASGVTMVKIPAILSNDIVPVKPEGLPLDEAGAFILPVVGDIRMVAVSPGLNHYSWLVGADSSAGWKNMSTIATNLADLAASVATSFASVWDTFTDVWDTFTDVWAAIDASQHKLITYRATGIATTSTVERVVATLVVPAQTDDGNLFVNSSLWVTAATPGDLFQLDLKSNGTIYSYGFLSATLPVGGGAAVGITSLSSIIPTTPGVANTLEMNLSPSVAGHSSSSFADDARNHIDAVFIPS